MRTVALTKESTKDILENLLKRSPNNYGKFESAVDEILHKCKNSKVIPPFLPILKNLTKLRSPQIRSKSQKKRSKKLMKLVDPALIDVIRKALVDISEAITKSRDRYSWFDQRKRTEPCSVRK